MTICKFPSELRRIRESKAEKKIFVSDPELIDIEDFRGDEGFGDEATELYSSISDVEIQLPFLLRLFIFGIALALFSASAALGLLSLAMGLLSGLTLGKIEIVEKRLKQFFRYFRRLFTTALGLLIACFSPPLGLGFITLYFSLQGESVEDNFINHLFTQHNR